MDAIGCHTATKTILLVDDEAAVRSLVRRILSGEGYQVLEAQSPEQALSIALDPSTAFDLLLSDIDMPHMNGFELAWRIGQARPGLCILFLTGGAGASCSTQHPILAKPFSADKLVQTVSEVLQ